MNTLIFEFIHSWQKMTPSFWGKWLLSAARLGVILRYQITITNHWWVNCKSIRHSDTEFHSQCAFFFIKEVNMLVKWVLNIHKPELSQWKHLNMLMDTNCEEGYYCFITSIIIESFMLDNSNQLHFKKKNLVSYCNLESFSIPVNFTIDNFSTFYKLQVRKRKFH